MKCNITKSSGNQLSPLEKQNELESLLSKARGDFPPQKHLQTPS